MLFPYVLFFFCLWCVYVMCVCVFASMKKGFVCESIALSPNWGLDKSCLRNTVPAKRENIEYNVLDVSLNAGGHTRSARAISLYYNLHPSQVPNMARLLQRNLWTVTNLCGNRVQGGYISRPLAAVLVTSSSSDITARLWRSATSVSQPSHPWALSVIIF